MTKKVFLTASSFKYIMVLMLKGDSIILSEEKRIKSCNVMTIHRRMEMRDRITTKITNFLNFGKLIVG